jgi:hypothetical protein
MYHPARAGCNVVAKDLHHPGRMRNTYRMNCRFFSDESKKKLWRPCREARALER